MRTALYVMVLIIAGVAWSIHPMFAFVILLSMLDANVELATEVDYENPQPGTGWAKDLHCWRAETGTWYYKAWKVLMGPNKPMTGYHAWRIPTMALFFHMPFFFNLGSWTGTGECNALFWFMLEGIVEDYLWFYFHPCYGPWKYVTEGRAGRIWWAPVYWGPFPKDYYMAIPVMIVLKVLAARL